MGTFRLIFDTAYQWVAALVGYDDIRVRSPEYLILLGFVPLVILLGSWVIIRQRRAVRMLGMRYPVVRRIVALLMTSIAIAAIIITHTRPFSVVVSQKPIYKGEAVQFIIDLSNSQLAEDIQRTDDNGKVSYIPRLVAVKYEIAAAVDGMSAMGISYFCLSYFTLAYNPLLECTDDIGNFKEVLARLNTSLAAGGGTDLLKAFGEDYVFVRSTVPKDTRITAIIVTDGGQEVCRKGDGSFERVIPDWNEGALRQRVEEVTTKERVRLIPVGVGGKELFPVPKLDTSGQKFYIRCKDGGVLVPRLDPTIIERVAGWAGDKSRYYILDRSHLGVHGFAAWLSSYMTAELVVDHYISQESTVDLRRWTLIVFIVSAALALGALGCIAQIVGKLAGRR